jgi:hypothetical protein
MVLTKDAAQVAGRKEDVPRSPRPRDGWLLTEVGSVVGNNGIVPGPAEPFFSLQAIYAAFSGAKLAVVKERENIIHGYTSATNSLI